MKFTFSWLKEHLDTSISVEDLETYLTNLGIEVASVHAWQKFLAPFCVGEVIKSTRHPEADRLSVCEVATASGTVQIVCGASNVRVGLKGIVALPGTFVPGPGITIKKANLRGVQSFGMLCSYQEVGLGDMFRDVPQGIAELPSSADLHRSVGEALSLEDVVFSVDVTPNRPDLLGVHGIARELAVAGVGRLKPLTEVSLGDAPLDIGRRLILAEDAQQGCPAFALALVDNAHKTWSDLPHLQKQLALIGAASGEVPVDITNYALFDEPRPLHAFDADDLVGDLTLRLSEEGEIFDALNGTSYTLNAGHMVLVDEAGIVSLAGVMGGMRGRIKTVSRRILVESAFFTPSWICRTARGLNLITDASLRFERGVDPASVMPGLARAVGRLREAGGVLRGVQVAGQAQSSRPSFTFEPRVLPRLSGMSLDRQPMLSLFDRMGLSPEDKGASGIKVTPPSWRFDLEGEACLVEEIVRFRGYDAILPVPLPPSPPVKPALSAINSAAFLARDFFVSRGLREVITWSFIAREKALAFVNEAALICLKNSCSEDMEVMRPSLIPGLLTLVAQHQARSVDMGCGFCEIGHTYYGAYPGQQQLEAGFVLPPSKRADWQGPVDLLWQAKSYVASTLRGLGVRDGDLKVEAVSAMDAKDIFHPHQTGVFKRGSKILAVFGALHPRILEVYGLQGPVYAGVLLLDEFSVRHKVLAPPPPSPLQRVTVDLGFLVPRALPSGDLVRALNKAVGAECVTIDLFDVFEDSERLGGDKVSLSFRLTLQPHKTHPSDAWLEAHINRAVDAAKPLGAVLRRDAAVA
jgi:phenylalanyl-tRNA synthetase beta chain